MLYLLIGAAAGLGIGAFAGWAMKCSSKRCLIAGNPRRGAFVGLVVGVLATNMLAPALMAAGVRGEVPVVNEETFRSRVLESDQPVLVDFSSPTCPPCLRLKPTIARLRKAYQGKAEVVEVNVKNSPELARRYGIRATPTVLIFSNGVPEARLIGGKGEQTYRNELDALLQGPDGN